MRSDDYVVIALERAGNKPLNELVRDIGSQLELLPPGRLTSHKVAPLRGAVKGYTTFYDQNPKYKSETLPELRIRDKETFELFTWFMTICMDVGVKF